MGRTDFDRTPFARPRFDEDFIPVIAYSDEVSVDDNSPLAETEVHFGDEERAKHASIFFDWHNSDMFQERELEIVCGYNRCSRELLNDALKEISALHGMPKTLTVTMARDNARCHMLFFQDLGFKRVADRSRKTWSFSVDLAEHKLRKVHRKTRSDKRIVNVTKSEPVEDIKFSMTIDEMQAKQNALAELRLKIQKLERS